MNRTSRRKVITGIAMNLTFSMDALRRFCRDRGIRRLSIFGSALREDFGPDSDIDVLVEFDADSIPTLLQVARMERELAQLFGGHPVDLRTQEDLSRYFRAQVIAEAQVQYAA